MIWCCLRSDICLSEDGFVATFIIGYAYLTWFMHWITLIVVVFLDVEDGESQLLARFIIDSGFWLVTICFILGFMKIHAVTLRLSCLCFDLLIELLYFLGLENFFFFYCLSRIMQNYVYVCGWGHARDKI
jgi:hypothetical protein